MSDLEALKKRRSSIKASLTRISNYLNKLDQQNIVIEQLESRKMLLPDILKQFTEIQTQIEYIDENEIDSDEFDRFETQYHDAVATIAVAIKNHNNTAQSRSNSPVSNHSVSNSVNVKLPTLDLPSFSGSYTKWVPFYNTYKSLIDDNAHLDNVQKMHYLKSCLKGEALAAIEVLPVSDANYNIAIQTLIKRYQNTRLIVQDHVMAIINAQNLNEGAKITLRQFIDDFNSNLAALEVLGIKTDTWDAILCGIITSKLDTETRRAWEATLDSEVPKIHDLLSFLEKRSRVSEILKPADKLSSQKARTISNSQLRNKSNNKLRASLLATNKIECANCKRAHKIHLCADFLKLSASNRAQRVALLKLCLNCLKQGHNVSTCHSAKCKYCGESHNSLLHEHAPAARDQVPAEQPSTSGINNETTAVSNLCSNTSQVLLSTAVVLVNDRHGNPREVRCLLDQGSQLNIIKESLCDSLGLETRRSSVSITGIGQSCSNSTRSTNIFIKSRTSDFAKRIDCVVLPSITDNVPSISFNTKNIIIPQGVKLADPNYNVARPVELLIGVEHFYQLLMRNHVKIPNHNLYLHDTVLGYIVSGAVYNERYFAATQQCHFLNTNNNINLEDSIERFWNQEEILMPKADSEVSYCENHFRNTHSRDPSDGRFVVELPFKNNEINLGQSYNSALQQFYKLENKLAKDKPLKKQYSEIIQDYLHLGYLEPVPSHEVNNPIACYLPHRPVVKEDSITTKVRIVVNGSNPTSNGLSLNDNLLVGPVIQDDLFSILIRFRTFQYAFSADLSKMYMQIKLIKSHTDFQRVLWRYHDSEPVKIFRLKRVSFGLASSSFLAIRCLHQLAQCESDSQPEVKMAIQKGFYVDDMLYGSSSLESAKKLQSSLTSVLSSAGFELRKWASNHPELLPNNDACASSAVVGVDEHGVTKTLGLLWHCNSDDFRYKAEKIDHEQRVTKRIILSKITKCFDPLGFLTPFLIRGKLLMQKLWSLHIDWDTPVPSDVRAIWFKICMDLEQIKHFSIPRCVLPYPPVEIQLHIFADASLKAYGAVAYLRSKTATGAYHTRLLTSKSRVAPLKALTIPRLELNAALLATRLGVKIISMLTVHVNSVYYWTDSSVVLTWLASAPNTWNTFVSNRVSQIQSLSRVDDWHHIPTKSNPADLITRGISARDLNSNALWFHGPSFLQSEISSWPLQKFGLHNSSEIPERRQVLLNTCVKENNDTLFINKYSNLSKLVRVTAYCLRWLHNTRHRQSPRKGSVSEAECNQALSKIIFQIQRFEFKAEMHDLKNSGEVARKSKLLKLSPFLDDQGLMRVGGRIKLSSASYDKKFPIILPAKHHLTKLLIQNEHVRLLHSGAEATLASLRERFWPLSARNTVRNIIHSCIRCFRANPKASNYKMGNLPADRLEPIRPFFKICLDYGGPFYIKHGGVRSTKCYKAYIALFVCMVSKACHIELVTDLSSQAFISALKRVISRRGAISVIYCDNATNFVGARNELQKIVKSPSYQNSTCNESGINNITWKFAPPRSPHFNGLAERLIRSAKQHVKGIAGSSYLTFEEMLTLLTQIEGILNSRPLTPLSSDPNDLVPLTPSHFLIGERITSIPEQDLTSIPINRLARWQRIAQLKQHFWKRFCREVYSQYQGRGKWRTRASKDIKIGDLVLIMDENLPPLSWRLGRVTQTHPGSDGIIRVVSLRTAHGTLRRALVKLCPLPIGDNGA